ncbi:exportin-T-like, partial [Tropilaelaps mercedesae]
VLAGQGTWLNCSYDPGDDVIYSLKWYKDNVEILGYMPLDGPRRLKVYNLTGVYIDLKRSTPNPANIYLSHTDRFSEGRYRCEVSGEAPNFHTARAHKDMTVVAIPSNGLVVSGLSERRAYGIGDLVNVSCSFGPSKPNASLDWFVNEIMMSAKAGHTLASHSVDAEGRSLITKTLTFSLTSSHFWRGEMKLQCNSLIRVEFNVSSEEIKIKNRGALIETSARVDGPLVTGLEKSYSYPSGLVELTCRTATYQDSDRIPIRLMWLYNDKEITNPQLVRTYQKMEDNATHTFHELAFRLNNPSFPTIAKGQDTKLRCVSTEEIEFTQHSIRVLRLRDHFASSASSDSALALQNHENRILSFLAAAYYSFVSTPHSSGTGPSSCVIITVSVIVLVAVLGRGL